MGEDAVRGAVALCCLALAGCATDRTIPPPNLEKRQLSAGERDVLKKSLSQAMKDPDAAQFKWMPVLAQPGATDLIGYCALVNGKNSFGGYTGFRRFYAVLSHDAKGQYLGGVIKQTAGARDTTFLDTGDDAIANTIVEQNCEKWGYTDFAAAQ